MTAFDAALVEPASHRHRLGKQNEKFYECGLLNSIPLSTGDPMIGGGSTPMVWCFKPAPKNEHSACKASARHLPELGCTVTYPGYISCTVK